jgi:hypothetical protein
MDELGAEQLAVLVADEWADAPWGHEAASGGDADEPQLGAYWPLDAPAPARRDLPAFRVRFVAAKALGTNLLFCFTLDDKPKQYILCFDVAQWNDGPDMAQNSVFEAVTRLVDYPNWEEARAGVLKVSSSLTIALV